MNYSCDFLNSTCHFGTEKVHEGYNFSGFKTEIRLESKSGRIDRIYKIGREAAIYTLFHTDVISRMLVKWEIFEAAAYSTPIQIEFPRIQS